MKQPKSIDRATAKFMEMPKGGQGHKRWQYTVAAVILVGVSLSAARLIAGRYWEDYYSRADFALQAENRVSVVRHELENNLSALNAIRGLAEVPGALTEERFAGFGARMLESHPSLRAVEWLEHVTAAQRPAFERTLQREGAPLPYINEGKPGSGKRAGARAEYYPVRFLYPRNEKNSSAIGFDFTCPSCTRALRASADADVPAATVKFHILEHTGDGYAVLVVLPVREGRGTNGPIKGYAMAILQVGDVVERAVRNFDARGINIQVYDLDAAPGSRLLYFHAARLGNNAHPLPEYAIRRKDGFEYRASLPMAGRSWLVVCTPTDEYIAAGRSWRPWIVFAVGLVTTGVVVAFFMMHFFHLSSVEGTNQLLNEQIQVRLQTESELAAARDQALAASRMKSQFLATMSHEIRTPMNGVIGMTHLLLDTPLTADQREYAGSVQRSAEALLTVINDILDLSRIEAGRLSVECSAFDLRRTIDDVLRALDPKAKEKDIDLRANFPLCLPTHFLGDELRIRQILMNLVGNAIKFTPSGEVSVHVQCNDPASPVCAGPRGSNAECPAGRDQVPLRISVRDSGIGIPADKLGLLFQKFSQVDSSDSRRFGGTGLGLAISKELVELLGGKIGVESNPDRGSTFWFTLPLPMALAAAPPPRPDTMPRLAGEFAGAAPRVLIAEDNPINLRVATVMLERLGIRPDTAVDGLQAVRLFREQPYDIILMDCQMPEMDGYLATAEIRRYQDASHPPVIIAMTADAMEGSRDRCLAAGMDDYVAKPVNRGALIEALNCWSRRYGRACETVD